MSAAAVPAGGGRRTGELAMLAVLALLVGGLLYWAFGAGERPLWRSAIGFDGLVAWLRADGLDARNFHGGAFLRRDGVGLRILPLYDGDLSSVRPVPASQDELLYQQDAVDLAGAVVEAKIGLLPTLVVLPKWRTGVAHTNRAHPVLLRDPGSDPVSRGQLDAGGGRVVRPTAGYGEFPGPAGLRARLYMPQVIRGSGCMPIVGDADGMVLGRCGRDDEEGPGYWLLADPDLLNSHGLRLGDNAAIARWAIGGLAGTEPIIVDYSTFVWTLRDRPGGGVEPEDKRTWADLGRFFAPPFAWLWAGFAVLAVLVLWRAAVRYGPVLRRYDDGPRAAKAVSIAAKARLLRLSGHDGALVRVHVADRLQAVAAELLGPHRRGGEPLGQVHAVVARRDPALGRRLHAAAIDAGDLPPGAATAEVARRLDRFEIAIEQVLHDFGRTSRSR